MSEENYFIASGFVCPWWNRKYYYSQSEEECQLSEHLYKPGHCTLTQDIAQGLSVLDSIVVLICLLVTFCQFSAASKSH